MARAAGTEPNESFYVRSFEACPLFDGNGGAYACASSKNGVGAFRGFSGILGSTTPWIDTVGFLDKGDTLYLCGTFLSTSRDYAGAMFNPPTPLAGILGEPIVIDGDCSAQGDLTEAVIDAQQSEDLGIQVGGAYSIWQHFHLKNTKSTAISSSFTQEPPGATFRHLKITDIGVGTAAGQNCLELNFSSYLVDDVQIGPCGNDGIFIGNGSTGMHQGEILNSTITGVSAHLSTGDGIQEEPGGGGVTIRNVRVTKRGTDKACILIGGPNGPAIIDGLDCSAEPGHGPFGGVTIDGAATGSYMRKAHIHDIPGGTGLFIRDAAAPIAGSLDLYENLIENTGIGVLLGGAHPAAAIKFHDNTLAGLTRYGIYALSNWNPGAYTQRNNVIESSGYQVYVDPTPPGAATDWDSDYNIFKGSGTYFYLSQNYATLSAYASASGDEAHSQSADASPPAPPKGLLIR